MSILPPACVPRAIEPLRLEACPEVDVIPYVANRLVFAHLVAQAISNRRYAQVLVDYPAFMEQPGWLTGPLAVLPLVSVAAFRSFDGSYRAIPFTPSNAAALAAQLAHVTGAPVRCVDDADLLNYPVESMFRPALATTEDYRVHEVGLDHYFAPLWSQLAAALLKADQGTRFFVRHRALQAARNVRKALVRDGPSLLVCEFQLWWALREALQAQDVDDARYLFEWKAPRKAQLILADPWAAWGDGLLDDFPGVTLRLWQALFPEGQDARADPSENATNVVTLPLSPKMRERLQKQERAMNAVVFDKRDALEQALWEAASHGQGSAGQGAAPQSVRAMLTFAAYLRRLVLCKQRLLPEAGTQLLPAAQACGGSDFVRAVRHAVLAYPAPPPLPQLMRKGLPQWEDFVCARTGLRFGCPIGDDDAPHSSERSARLKAATAARADETAWRSIASTLAAAAHGIEFAIPQEYALHAAASARAREFLRRWAMPVCAAPSAGSIERGIHWPATIAARVGGEPHIYVRQPQRTKAPGADLDVYAPTVFLFESDSTICQSELFTVEDHNTALRCRIFNIPLDPARPSAAPDKLLSVTAAAIDSKRVAAGHLRIDTLSAIAFLCTSSRMGPERYDDLIRRPRRFQCRTDPREDPDLAHLPKPALLVAWAAKYAHRTVIVAAPNHWRPSTDVAAFARVRGVCIHSVPLSFYPRACIARLRHFHFVSGTIKGHPRRDDIIRQLIV